MIKVLKSKNYKIMPWKNGQGVTSEIAIDPSGAEFPRDDFLWRFSSAKIQAENIFSIFDGYDRALVVIKGDGFILNGLKHLPLTPLYFSGESVVKCELVNGEALDLGVIYKKNRFDVKMIVHKFEKANPSVSLSLTGNVNFIFCVSGEIQVGDDVVSPFDSIRVEDSSGDFHFFVQDTALCILISILEK